MTSLARCCRPAPPDAIDGFVTRGKGVAIHRRNCSNLRHMRERAPERVIAVEWGRSPKEGGLYPIDVLVEAGDRPGLLRDITEVFAKANVNVTGVQQPERQGQRRRRGMDDIHGRSRQHRAAGAGAGAGGAHRRRALRTSQIDIRCRCYNAALPGA